MIRLNGFEIASLIAAIAFLLLVVSIILLLNKLTKVAKNLESTVVQVNHTIEVITTEVSGLSNEVKEILGQSKYLIKDLNNKLDKTNPIFTAIGDVGETVSDVNDSTRSLASKVTDKVSHLRTQKLRTMIKVGKQTKK